MSVRFTWRSKATRQRQSAHAYLQQSYVCVLDPYGWQKSAGIESQVFWLPGVGEFQLMQIIRQLEPLEEHAHLSMLKHKTCKLIEPILFIGSKSTTIHDSLHLKKLQVKT